jgi:hypothetical protein
MIAVRLAATNDNVRLCCAGKLNAATLLYDSNLSNENWAAVEIVEIQPPSTLVFL